MTQAEMIIKMVLDRWNVSLRDMDKLLSELTDETLLKEVSPGKNRGIYLLGHLIAVHDDMLRLLDMGDRQYPALQKPFIKSPDKAIEQSPPVAELKDLWAG